MARSLDGLTVIDLSRYLPGQAATRLLADAGAHVTLIVPPGPPPRFGALALEQLHHRLNHGKRILPLDLKTAEGHARFLDLVAEADVLLEAFRPGVMERLGLGYEHLSAGNSRLIYASLTGYGQSGPYRDLAGHDINYLAMTGVLDVIGRAGEPPAIPGVQIADLSAGSQQTVIAIQQALLERHATGRGQHLDISMAAGAAWLMQIPLAEMEAGRTVRRGEHLLSGRYACYNVYRAGDGRYVAVGALEPRFWAELCRLLDRPDLIADQYAGEPRRSEIREAVQSVLLTRSAAEWFALARTRDACLTPVRTLAEAQADGEDEERG